MGPECQLFLFQRGFADIPPCHNGYNSALVVTELLGSEFAGPSEAIQDPKGALCQGPGVWPKAAARCWWTRRGLRAPRGSSETQKTLLRHKISFANSPKRKNRRISWRKQSFQWVYFLNVFIFVNFNFRSTASTIFWKTPSAACIMYIRKTCSADMSRDTNATVALRIK